MSERLRETLRSKTGDKEFTYLNRFWFFLSAYVCLYEMTMVGKLFKRRKLKHPSRSLPCFCLSWHWGTKYKTLMYQPALTSSTSNTAVWSLALRLFWVWHCRYPSGITSWGTTSCSCMNSEKALNSVAVMVVWWVVNRISPLETRFHIQFSTKSHCFLSYVLLVS